MLTPQGAQAISAGFNKKFGLNVKLQYSPSGNMTRDIGKVVGFGASGVPPEWDLMVVTDAHHSTLWVKKDAAAVRLQEHRGRSEGRSVR